MARSPTIAALASGPGFSDRAVIRLSGPGTFAVCARLFDRLPGDSQKIAACRFHLCDDLDLPCLALRFDGPRSFTGEDSLEIVLPGNPTLLGRVVSRLLHEPEVREATPGEFSARAYLNNKLSLDQAEGLAATIAARTDEHLSAAAGLLSGRTGSRYRAWSDEVATLLALVEAGIDFTDQEDVVPIAPRDVGMRLDALASAVAGHLGHAGGAEHATGTPRIVLVGAPNAGKSTLFNALLGRTRAVVAPLAGTTRDVLAEQLDLSREAPGASAITLIDLAGLDARLADGPGGVIDLAAQEAARAEIAHADAIVWCDPSGRFAEPLPEHRARTVIRVTTKADLAGVGAAARVSKGLGAEAMRSTRPHTAPPTGLSGETQARPVPPREGATIAICALDGWNLGTLKRALADATWGADMGAGTWLLPRHRRVLALTLEHLRSAAGTLDPAAHALKRPELTASALREALDLLGELTGRLSPDDIIGRVFATFCVGK